MKFISSNISTYLKIKHKSDLKIYGNPFYKKGFFNHLNYLFKYKRQKFVDFTKIVIHKKLENVDESEKEKVFNFLKPYEF